MPPKPRFLLCDAVSIITAHELGVWDKLCSSYEILVPSIVIDECEFYRDDQGQRIPIDLRTQVQQGIISEYQANPADFAATSALLHPELRARVHAGEREALTYLRINEPDDVWFVTADGGAIEAAVAFDRGDRAVSLEMVLRRIGITKQLEKHHTDAFVVDHRRRGSIIVAQGRALSQ